MISFFMIRLKHWLGGLQICKWGGPEQWNQDLVMVGRGWSNMPIFTSVWQQFRTAGIALTLYLGLLKVPMCSANSLWLHVLVNDETWAYLHSRPWESAYVSYNNNNNNNNYTFPVRRLGVFRYVSYVVANPRSLTSRVPWIVTMRACSHWYISLSCTYRSQGSNTRWRCASSSTELCGFDLWPGTPQDAPQWYVAKEVPHMWAPGRESCTANPSSACLDQAHLL